MTEPKIGDAVTILVSADERHIKDLWWWDGARGIITATHEGRYRLLTADGRKGWFERRMLVLTNEVVR